MIITTQYTHDYHEKAFALINSLDLHWDGDVRYVPFSRRAVQSYREHWPKNRDSYASMQAGEFLQSQHQFNSFSDDEVIICLDTDTIMNRPFTTEELSIIESMLEKYDFLSVYGAYPATPLSNVLVNLGAAKNYFENTSVWQSERDWFHRGEFTASFLIAKKKNFAKLKKWYLEYFDRMTELTGHHAGGQWLINWIVYTKMSVGILGKQYQCGSWYDGCTEEDANNAVFNHTK